MSDKKRKSCQTPPKDSNLSSSEENSKPAAKIFKSSTKMPISDSDLIKIKSIIDGSIDSKITTKLVNLATKDDLQTLSSEITALKKQNEELTTKVQHIEARCNNLEMELELQNRELKASNVILTIPKNDIDVQKTVDGIVDLLLGTQDKHEMPPAIKLSENQSITKLKLSTGSSFLATRMLKNATKLKGTSCYIQRDLTKQLQHKRRILLSYRKVIKSKQPNAPILLKNNALVIGKDIFYLTNNNKLIHNNNDGEQVLIKMFGELNFEAVKLTLMSNSQQANSKITSVMATSSNGAESSRNSSIQH